MDKDIRIKISTKADTKAIDTTSRRIGDLGSKARTTTSSLNTMDNSVGSLAKRAVVLGVSIYSVSEAMDAAVSSIGKLDELTNLDGRLKLVTKTTAEYNKTQKELLTLSNDARVKLTGTVDLYTRLKRSTEDLNKSNQDILTVTDSINKSLIVSGASATESSAALTQLGQGLSSGVLRGEEFNSVMEQTTRLAKLIADGIGVGTGKLREMAGEGKLTADVVFNAILSQKDIIEKEFRQMPVTVAQSLTVMDNNQSIFLKGLDKKYDITKSISSKIEDVSNALKNNNDQLVNVVDGVITFGKVTLGTIVALKTYNGLMAASVVLHNRLTAALVLAAVKQRALNLAVKANPYVIAATAVYGLVKALDSYYDTQKKIEKLKLDTKNGKFDRAKELSELTIAQQKERLTKQIEAVEKGILAVKNNSKIAEQKKLEILQLQNKSLANLKAKYDEINKPKKVENSIKPKELTNDQLNEYLDFYTKIGDLDKAWNIKRQLLSKQNTVLTAQELQQKLAAEKEIFFKKDEKLKKEKEIITTSLSDWQDYYLSVGDIQTAWLIRASQLSKQYVDLNKQQLSEILKLKEQEFKQNAIENTVQYKSVDLETTAQIDMLDTQKALIESTNSWGNSLEGVAGKIGNITGAFANLSVNNIEFMKKEAKLESKYKKDKLKYANDSKKLYEIENKYTADKKDLKEQTFRSEISGYAAVAGAMSGAFEEGSGAAKAFMAVQQGLSLYNAVGAVLQAWNSAPFPYNLPAVATTSAAVVGLLAQIGQTFSSGSGGSGSPYTQEELASAKATELNDQTVIDELKQQTKFLEAIEKNGSSQALSVDLAKAEFTQAKNEWVQEVYDASRIGYVHASFDNPKQDFANISSYYSGKNLVNPYEMSGDNIRIRTEYFRENPDDLIKVIADMSEFIKGDGFSYTGPFGQELAKELGWGAEAHQAFLAQVRSNFSEIQGYLNDWAISVVESTADLKGSAEDMKGYYDSITGTNYYAKKELAKAYTDFNSLLKNGQSYSDYLKSTITKINESSKFIYQLSGILDENGKELSNYELLLSKNGDLIDEQIAKVDEFGTKVGLTFDNGIEDAINYLDAIELVSNQMVLSAANVKTYQDSFKTDVQLANDLAANVGVNSLATSLQQLDNLFIKLKSDTYGLTDAELELLQANKSLIEGYNDIISQLDNIISPKTLTLGSVNVEDATLDTAADILDNLQDAKQAEIDAATQDINDRKAELQARQKIAKDNQKASESLKKAFESTAKSLTQTYKDIIGQTSLGDSFTVSEYNSLYSQIKDGIAAGTDVSDLTSEFNKYATAYAAYIKDDSASSTEYERRMKILANEVKDLAGKSETASLSDVNKSLQSSTLVLNSIESQLEGLDGTLQTKIDSINATYIQQTQALKDALENSYTGTVTNKDTSIVSYSDLVADAYKDVLGRVVDDGGKEYWVNELKTGKISESDIYKAIANAGLESTIASDRSNAQEYIDEMSKTTVNQTTNYYKEDSSSDGLDKVVKELQRLNIISSANAEATKKILKTQKQSLITSLQETA